MVGLGEAAIDDHQASAGFDGILALRHMNGYVAIDDMTIGTFYLEGIEDTVAHLGRITKFEVVAFLLMIRFLVGEEIAFEGGHLRLIE